MSESAASVKPSGLLGFKKKSYIINAVKPQQTVNCRVISPLAPPPTLRLFLLIKLLHLQISGHTGRIFNHLKDYDV